jgi:ATP-binding cassette subfamily B protein
MTVTAEKEKIESLYTDKELLVFLWSYVKAHTKIFNVVIVTLILNTLLSISSPLFFRYVVDVVEQGLTSNTVAKNVKIAIFAYIAFNLISWLLRSIQFVYITKLNTRVVKELRIDAFQSIIDNKVQFFDQNESGDITSRVVNDTKELYDASRDIAWVINNILRLIVTVSVLFYFSVYLTLASLLFAPIVIGISILLGKYERRTSALWRKKFGEVNQRFAETMSKIQISKAFNREEENLNRFKKLNEATFKASIKRALAIFIFWPMTDLLKHLLLIIVLVVGIWEIERGMPISTLILFLVLQGYFYWPLIGIADNFHKFQGAFASLERVINFSKDDTLKEQQNGSSGFSDEISGSIRFDNVTFGYDPEKAVLRNISFTIKPGQRVALVGHTGAGKSTIASLMTRFYDAQEGEILIDEKPIKDYNLSFLRSNISLVSQRVSLFQGTIRENLLISKPDATDEQLWSSLEAVQAMDFIAQLPNGLDTYVEEGGKNLSVGQRQMISFARSLLANPKILILDEATSSVDLFTESKIQTAIDVLLSERTSISIAHRLTTIMRSDLIVVLSDGEIIEMGNHQELVKGSGHYAEMYKLYFETQSAKYLENIKGN